MAEKQDILREVIADLHKDVDEAEVALNESEKVAVSARQKIITIKMKIAKLEQLL